MLTLQDLLVNQRIPSVGDTVLLPSTGEAFAITRRTKREDGAIYLWNGETPHHLADCQVIPPELAATLSQKLQEPPPKTKAPFEVGDIVHKRHNFGWTGVITRLICTSAIVQWYPDSYEQQIEVSELRAEGTPFEGYRNQSQQYFREEF